MEKQIFLIGWIERANGACSEKTGIVTADDLLPLYLKGSPHVCAYKYEAPKEFACDIGRCKAFIDNWTSEDSVSDCISTL